MKIYSVLITSNYGAERLDLFTSLKKCVEFVKAQFEDQKEILDLEYIDFDEMGCSLKNIRKSLNIWENGYHWSGSIYTDYRYTIEIQKHDTNMNHQYGGF